jgi:hypothetical protein
MLTEVLFCLALAAGFSGLLFLLNKRNPVSPDEGYLWYGTLRVLEGEVPLRDFRSYEPGRYYWCALCMLFFGKGILGLRAGVCIFYFLGLGAGLVALRLGGLDWAGIIAAAAVLTVWAYPQHKLFEPALSMFAIFAGVLLIAVPGPGTFMLAGAMVGVIAIAGINYGAYAGAGLFLLTLLAGLKAVEIEVIQSLTIFFSGLTLGFAPFVLMLLFISGLAATFYERRVKAVLARGTTNLPLPRPWPWRPVPRGLSGLSHAGQHAVRWLFVLLPAFCWGLIVWAWFLPWPHIQATPAAFAAAFIGAFSLHHAMSRADLPHLSQSMPPLILGLVGLFAGLEFGWVVPAAILGFAAFFTVCNVWPAAQRRRRPEAYEIMEIGSATLWVSKGFSGLTRRVRTLVNMHLQPGESVLALPTLLALYPMMGLRAPVYDIFCVYPASPEEEERMLRSIESSRVRVAIIDNGALDGREELQFSNTHPRVWSYIRDRFEPVEVAEPIGDLHIFIWPGQCVA